MRCNMISEGAYRIRSVLRVIFKREKKDRRAGGLSQIRLGVLIRRRREQRVLLAEH